MWIEVHQSLATHRKTLVLCDILKIEPVQAVGHLTVFWQWSVDNAPRGQLVNIGPKVIATASQWRKEPVRFTDALVTAGFIDRTADRLSIHNWDKYMGRLIDARDRKAERMRIARAKHVADTLPTRSDDVLRNPTVPYLTVPNPTQPDLEVTNVTSIAPNGADKTSTRKNRVPTENDQYLEAFCDSIGTRPGTKSEWAKWGTGVKEIRSADPVVTLEEIPDIVHLYRKRCPTLPCNPSAIASHLSDYRNGPSIATSIIPEHDGIGEPAWKAHLRTHPLEPTRLNVNSSGRA